MKHLITFDISNNRQRQRVVKECLAIGFRVQKSVFETYIQPIQLKALEEKLLEMINPEHDSIRIYPLDKEADSAVRIVGTGKKINTPKCAIF